LRPQLKRDPLGGALPPHKHSSGNSIGMVMRGAPRAETHGRAATRRAPPPKSAAAGARCALPLFAVAAQKLPKAGWAVLPWGAQRARASMKGAPSNTRLKLAAPGTWGNLSFVTNQARRRSLSAGR